MRLFIVILLLALSPLARADAPPLELVAIREMRNLVSFLSTLQPPGIKSNVRQKNNDH